MSRTRHARPARPQVERKPVEGRRVTVLVPIVVYPNTYGPSAIAFAFVLDEDDEAFYGDSATNPSAKNITWPKSVWKVRS